MFHSNRRAFGVHSHKVQPQVTRLIILHCQHFPHSHAVQNQFFNQFPRKRIAQGFARDYFAAGKLPKTTMGLVSRPLRKQIAPTPRNHRSDHVDDVKNSLRWRL